MLYRPSWLRHLFNRYARWRWLKVANDPEAGMEGEEIKVGENISASNEKEIGRLLDRKNSNHRKPQNPLSKKSP